MPLQEEAVEFVIALALYQSNAVGTYLHPHGRSGRLSRGRGTPPSELSPAMRPRLQADVSGSGHPGSTGWPVCQGQARVGVRAHPRALGPCCRGYPRCRGRTDWPGPHGHLGGHAAHGSADRHDGHPTQVAADKLTGQGQRPSQSVQGCGIDGSHQDAAKATGATGATEGGRARCLLPTLAVWG